MNSPKADMVRGAAASAAAAAPREREICARLGGPDVAVKIRDAIEAKRAGK